MYAYKQLEANNIPVKYEEDRFTLLEKFESDSEKIGEKVRAMTFKPDFTNSEYQIEIEGKSYDGFVIECKGNPNDAFPLRWKLFKDYLRKNDLNYKLFLPRNKKQVDQVVNILKRE